VESNADRFRFAGWPEPGRPMLDPNRPRQYEVLGLAADGTYHALEIISCGLKAVTHDAAVFQMIIALPSGFTVDGRR
jgi:hypothetical protein